MELPLMVVSPGRPPTPVLLQTDPGTTVAEAATALAERLDLAAGRARPAPEATSRPRPAPEATSGAPVELYHGPIPLAGTDELAGCRLAHGSVVGLGAPPPPAPIGPDGVELAVVGGLEAGWRVDATPPAVITVGRSVDNMVALDDPQASRHHARLDLRPDAAVLEDLGSTNGVGWAGYRLGGPQALTLGDSFLIGDTVLALRAVEPGARVLDPVAGGGTRHFNRPPRLPPPPVVTDLNVPTEPEKPTGRRFPLLSLLAPVAIGAVLVAVLHSLIYLAFIVLAPVMGLSNYLGDRRHGRREYRTKLATYQREVAQLEVNLAAAVAADERARRTALPDPAAIARIATAPTTRLWERRIDDDDFLRVRVGMADLAANVNLRGKAGGPTPTAHLVPVSFDAADAGVMGLAGPRPATLALARAVIVAAAVLHSPRDLRMGVLAGPDTIDDWAWMAWLPHLIPLDPTWGSRRFVGAGRQQAEERLAALRRLIDDRRELARNQLRTGPPAAARVLVVLDGARRLRALEGLTDVLRTGPDAGVLALCLDDHETSLPEECRVTVAASNETDTRMVVRRRGAAPVNDVIADGMGTEMADEVARALAPVRDAGPASGGGTVELPRSLRLLDLVGLDEPTEADVARVWRGPGGGRSTEAVLGAGPSGPFVVDLRRDGPHGLVAGTTGAGKSELLQSFVASLALANRPDALAFVLVDYKGGSAFKECRELPHCVGLVTDLDGHLASRALASLTAELKRREGLLAQAGAANIEDYWATTPQGTSPHLPRLAIVVDEFATLVDEVPEFVQGVIGIGMRGRSLGVHVVLATQRPAGVVSAELRANVNLRLCLRVANPEESTDVIDVPDAARIARDTPGRAYALTGYRDLTLFQTARIGVPRATGSRRGQPRAVTVEPLKLTGLGARVSEDPQEEAEAGAPTDLSVLVGAIAAAATTEGIERPASPWLPPLPDLAPLVAPAAAAGPASTSTDAHEAVIGLIDRPEAQAQEPFVLNLDRTGSVLVIGAVRSGRSTTLRTIAAGLVAACSPEDLYLYGIDCGNRALDSLAALPHCGAVVSGDDPERLIRLVDLLSELVRHRGQTGQSTPSVVILVDRLEAFVARYAERDGGRLVDRLDQLLREGGAVGVTFVISGDRTAFTTRLSSAVEARLVLRQADRSDYGLVGLDVRRIPAHMPNGRALWAQTGHEVQIGMLDSAWVEVVAGRWPEPAPGRRARRVDPLPDRVSLAEVAALASSAVPAETGNGTGNGAVVTIGAGGDELTAMAVDLSEAGPGFIVSGPPRSGRSTALATMVYSLATGSGDDRSVVIVAPRASPLRELGARLGVAAVLTGNGAELASEIEAAMSGIDGPAVLVIDDAELLGDGPPARTLEALVRTARDTDLVVVAAATTDDLLLSRFRGWLADARRGRSGLLLNPASAADGEVFDLRLPRSTGGGWPPGRALLALRGHASPVQIAVPEDPGAPQ